MVAADPAEAAYRARLSPTYGIAMAATAENNPESLISRDAKTPDGVSMSTTWRR